VAPIKKIEYRGETLAGIATFLSTVSIAGITIGLEFCHWPTWLAVIAGILLGFAFGFILLYLCGRLLDSFVWLSRGKIAFEQTGSCLVVEIIIQTLIYVALALLLVPAFAKARQKAEQHRREQAIHVQTLRSPR